MLRPSSRSIAKPGIERGAGFTVEEAAAKLASLDVYPNYRIFVAVLDGKIVGTYALLIMDNLAKRGARIWHR